MDQVFLPRGAINQYYIIKKMSTNFYKKWRIISFIGAWKVAKALVKPNGITKNS